ncbi:MAG: 50S ribosomal protein L35 [Candidatus Vogelbacteria bacterium CG10_big_fil_rev_8_21_14_0_10_50_13]|uniref:50S ribosomal protein L35 n=1 Tax=Candidatus Vogelbacteria bacterium CG10_big_fil_rev_8_21_14_0_10_50_13 TaxID=1975044 RepID=A0A2H0RG47_9BACT|nr:MAG: 50S ribosomal protein L35 [Candidatus Vogelbacteria bacterium CG10_big_fil_rev_8_21_14_0_10_50_13]
MKTNKSYTKRLKVTKNGKILARKAGQNHFNAKAPRSQQLAGKSTRALNFSNRTNRRFLPKSN